ncbi:MAG TPA: hypothetical protein VGR28_13465 [Candidatus Thermoplasmatota archaeon]|nr:hypothetical protein [Candidatus Thermoplasmatota archaeon]
MILVLRPESKVALGVFGILVVAAVGMVVLPSADDAAEQHQLPGAVGPLTVTVQGSPPSGVAVSANYPVSLEAGQVAQVGGPLLEISASGLGPGGAVTLRAYPPGEDMGPRTIEIPGGLLLLEGDPSQQLTVSVTTPTGTPLEPGKEVARVTIDAQAATIDVDAVVNANNQLHMTFSKFWSVEYDEAGNAIGVAFVNPLSTVEGRLKGKDVPPSGLSTEWLHLRVDQNQATLDLLRTGLEGIDGAVPSHTVIPLDSARGDPLGEGLVIRADGEDKLTLQLEHLPPDLVRATVGGAVLQDALGGPLVLGLHHYGLLPWNSLLEMYHQNGAGEAFGGGFFQVSTLRPLFQAWQDPTGASFEIPPFARSVFLPDNQHVNVWADDHSGAIQLFQNGANTLTAEVVPGGADGSMPDVILSGAALAGAGLEDPTHVSPSFLAGLIVGTSGSAQDAATAILADNAGNILAEASQEDDGVHARLGADEVVVADGRIVVVQDPVALSGAHLMVLDGSGAPVLDAQAAGLTPTAVSPSGLPIITATAGGQTITLASPLELYGDTGAWSGFRILNPVNSAEALVEFNEDGLFVLGDLVAPPDPGLSGAGDPLGDPVVTLEAGPATITVDRTTTPPTITVAGVEPPEVPPTDEPPQVPPAPEVPDVTTIQVPIVVEGPPTAPTGVIVYDPQTMPDGEPLFELHDLPTGTSVVTLPNGETLELPSNLVQSEGLPLASPQWKLTLRPPGQAPQSVVVDRADVQAQLYGNGVDISPFVALLAGAGPDVDFYKVASDGHRSLDPANMTGARWLNGNGDITVRVDVPKKEDHYAPVLLWADGVLPVRGSAPSAAMQLAGGDADFTSYRAAIPASWLQTVESGHTVHFALGFDLNAANLATQSFADDGDGQGYRFQVDRAPPTAASVSVAQPDADAPTHLRVSWSATDAGSGVATYTVQKQKDDGPWEELVPEATGTSRDVTGEAGHTYKFRARATDAVGNVGPLGSAASISLPAPPPPPPDGSDGNETGSGGEDVNHAPTIHLLAPLGGEVFQNARTVLVRWAAADPDGTTPIVTLWGSGDGGSNWGVIASPEGTEYSWDVARLSGTDFRVKAAVSDGSLQDADTSARFTIDNAALLTEESIGGTNPQQQLPGSDLTPPGNANQGPQGGAAAAADTMTWLVLGGALAAVVSLAAAWKLGWLKRKP